MLEAIALLVLWPLSWFPWQWPLLTLIWLPMLPTALLARLRLTGRLTAQSGLEPPLTYLLLATCVAAIPVVDVQLALPKILGIAVGVAAVITIGNWVDSTQAARRSGQALIGSTMLLVGVGLVGTEWTTGKLVVLNAILERLPTLGRGLVPNTPRGGINPNELAGVLVLLIPVTLGQIEPTRLLSGTQRWWNVAAAVGAGTALLLLVATASRSAVAATAVVLSAWAAAAVVRTWRNGAQSRTIPVAGVAALVGLLLAEAGAAFEIARRAPLLTAGAGSDTLQGRIEVWDRALAMLRDFPITGIGPGQFDPVFHLLYAPQNFRPDQFVPHAHSLLLAYAVELGMPGFAAFTVLLVAFFRCCMRAMRGEDAYVRRTGLTLALGVLAFLGFGLTDAIAPGARGGVVLWVMLGLGGALGRLASDNRRDGTVLRPVQEERVQG